MFRCSSGKNRVPSMACQTRAHLDSKPSGDIICPYIVTSVFASVLPCVSARHSCACGTAAGTPCALDSCSGPVRTPNALGVCRRLGPRVFPDGRCCRWAGGRGVPASANHWSRRSGFPGLWRGILAGTGYFGAVLFTLGSLWQGEGELESSSFHPLLRGVRQHFGFGLYVL